MVGSSSESRFKKQQEDAQAAFQRHRAEQRRLAGYVAKGNGAGGLAALGLIGTSLRTSGEALTYPLPLFWVFIAFLIGLAATWFSLSIDERFAKHSSDWISGKIEPDHGIRIRIRRLERAQRTAYWTGAACLVAGLLLGLWHLGKLASP